MLRSCGSLLHVGRVRHVTEPTDRGRELRLAYTFRGALAELEQTLPLVADESILFHGVMQLHAAGAPTRPAVLRLTTPRLVILAHYPWRSNRAWELPRPSVQGVELLGAVVQIDWTDQQDVAQALQLGRWTGRAAFDRPIRDASEAAEALDGWLRDL